MFGSRKRRKFKKLRREFSAHKSDVCYDWNWRSIDKNRIALVHLLINLRKGLHCRYLEIGCYNNTLFDTVYCNDKVGVDPEKGGTCRKTSDDFFDQNTKNFDVVFIDGLHEYAQVRQDAINALNCLADGGWIAFHDFLPRNWIEQHVPCLNNACWTGDCWKLAVELTNSPDVDFRILNIDHGVGVMRPRVKNAKIVDMRHELQTAQYDYFVNVLPQLPRCDWAEGVEWINACLSHTE